MWVPPPNSFSFSLEAEDFWALILNSPQAHPEGALALKSCEEEANFYYVPKGNVGLAVTTSFT